MVAPTNRENAIAIIVVLVVLSLASASVYQHRNTIQVSPGESLGKAFSPTATPTYTPAIPTSSAGAQAYLDQAASAAAQGDYAQATQILTQARAAYPEDKNVSLSLSYYQNLATQHGQ